MRTPLVGKRETVVSPFTPFGTRQPTVRCCKVVTATDFVSGAVGGGFYLHEGEIPNRGVSLHLFVPDIAAALAKVKSAGGTVTKEEFLIGPDIGYNAFFKDTEGNEVGLFSCTASKK
jgi:predicted enzyme related to lactoylglutathione lyase